VQSKDDAPDGSLIVSFITQTPGCACPRILIEDMIGFSTRMELFLEILQINALVRFNFLFKSEISV